MAVTSFDPRNPQFQICGSGIPQVVYGHDEDASESFKAGQLVYFDASGQVIVVPDGGTEPVAGIALKDATNTSASNAIEIPVQLITMADELLIQVGDTSGSYEASNTTCVPGVGYDTQIISTNLHILNSADTSNQTFVYVGPVLNAAGASTYWGRVRPYYLENQISAE